MIFNVVYSSEARQDLRDIYKLSRKLNNEQAEKG